MHTAMVHVRPLYACQQHVTAMTLNGTHQQEQDAGPMVSKRCARRYSRFRVFKTWWNLGLTFVIQGPDTLLTFPRIAKTTWTLPF